VYMWLFTCEVLLSFCRFNVLSALSGMAKQAIIPDYYVQLAKQTVAERNTKLFRQAIIASDLDSVKKLTEKSGVDVNTMMFNDETALHIACQKGCFGVVQCLLVNGAFVDIMNSHQQTPLYIACENGHDEVVECLLDNGASVNVGENALIVAVRKNHYDCVELLLEHDANVNCTDSEGKSSMQIAIQNMQTAMQDSYCSYRDSYSQRSHAHAHQRKMKLILLLLEYGATVLPSLKDISCELLMNAEDDHEKAVQRLIDESLISLKSESTYLAAFDYAFTHGAKELAEKLMMNYSYSGIKQLSTKGAYYSAKHNWPDVLSKLLEERVDINALTCCKTPLYIACEEGHESIVRLLLDNGADPNIQNDSAESTHSRDLTFPLHVAVYRANSTIINMLLKRGASLNPPGEPLLHIVCTNASNDAYKWKSAERRSLEHAVIRLLLQQGVNVNAISDKGDTALYRACKSRELEVVQILLDAGADINLTSEKLFPLIAACEAGSAEFINLLVKAGADVKCRTRYNETCLMAIASLSRYFCHWKTAVVGPLVRLLLQQGVDINAVSSDGDTALYRACERQQLAVVKTMLEAGADMNLTSNRPLTVACCHGSTKMLNLLLEAGADTKCNCSESFLHVVIKACVSEKYFEQSADKHQEIAKRYMSVAEILLSAGADINQVDRKGASALYLACDKGETEFAKLLLSRGANPDMRSDTYPILAACKGHHYDIAKLLLNYNADVAVVDSTGKTVLHYVLQCVKSRQKQAELIELLLARGANVNEASDEGETPFYIACSKGLESVVQKMLACSAKVNARSYKKVALSIACLNGHLPVIHQLLASGADVNLKAVCDDPDDPDYVFQYQCYSYTDESDKETPFYIACCKGLESVAKEMLQYGAKVNGNSAEFLPLNAACRNGHVSVVKLLLTNGASVNLREVSSSYDDDDDSNDGMYGSYPLCVAATGNKRAIVELLLKHGAKVDIGWCTPLHDAIKKLTHALRDYDCHHSYIETKLSIIRSLLEHGANVNTLMHNGMTPLKVAVNALCHSECYIDELLQLMVKYGAELQDLDPGVDSSSPEDLNVLSALATFNGRCKFVIDMFRAGARFHLLAHCCNSLETSFWNRNAIPLCQAAVLAGYKPSTRELDNLQTEADGRSNYMFRDLILRLLIWLNEVREQVPSLQRQCRVVIRQQLSVAARFKTMLPALEQMAEQLELPRIVKEYLQFDGPLTEVDLNTILYQYCRFF